MISKRNIIFCFKYVKNKFILFLKFFNYKTLLLKFIVILQYIYQINSSMYKSSINFKFKVPKSGYINVNDFASPKQLADYLIYLNDNSTAYKSFFAWKKHVKFFDTTIQLPSICEMCIKLHLEDHFGIEKRIFQNLGDYWDKKSQCKKAKMGKVNLEFEDF